MKLERSVVIHRPLSDVFALAGDPQNDTQWGSLIVASRQLSEGPIGPGTVIEQTATFMGARIAASLVITAYELNSRVCYKASRPFPLEHCRRFEEVSEGTELTFVIEADAESRFKVAGTILSRMAGRQMEDDLEALKDLLEAHQPADP